MEHFATPPLEFSGVATSQDQGIMASETAFERSRASMAGGLRMASHALVMASGVGIGTQSSKFRVLTGVLGFAAAATLFTFGHKKTPDEPQYNGHPLHAVRPKGLIETSSTLFLLSSLSLLASGIVSKRPIEAINGAWASTAYAIQRFAPEREPDLKFEQASSENLGFVGQLQRQWEIYKNNPVKLSSDMLQVAGALALADGVVKKDKARAVSGILLMTSNLLMRGVRRDDFHRYDESAHAR